MKKLALIGSVLIGVPLGLLAYLSLIYAQGRRKTASFYDRPGLPKDDGLRLELGTVKTLRVLPLIDYYAASRPPDLETEPGVSYWVQADDTTILFDLGLNRQGDEIPPLLRNMTRLGLDLRKIDLVVNSHPHQDHLGSRNPTFIQRLAGKPIYSTVPLEMPSLANQVVDAPQVLAPGVATTGPLPVQLFFLGYTLEQALVVNVEGKGLVLLIGCGHPGVEALVERAAQVFQKPIYGVIGGLHYPIMGDRVQIGPIPIQRLLGSANPPWLPPHEDTVYQAIDYLKRRQVSLVSLSAHDSCDWSLGTFSDAFGDSYLPLHVGQDIVVGK